MVPCEHVYCRNRGGASILSHDLLHLTAFTDFISMKLRRGDPPPPFPTDSNRPHADPCPRESASIPFLTLFPSPSVRWSSRPWTRRATPTCRGLWSRVRRPREESTPSTRPLFSNIDPPCPLLCVCAFQRLPPLPGPPRPGAGHKQRTRPRHLTG